MRDEDTAFGKPASEELRDIHKRIDTLHAEGQHQFSTVTERLHAIELRLADRPRFPLWLPASLTAIGLFLGGQTLGAVWWASAINEQVQGISYVRETCCEEVPVLAEKVRTLDEKVVGRGKEGWHRPDHDQYAAYIEERFKRLEESVQRLHGGQP